MSETYQCEPAGPAHADGLLALFEGSGSGCFCNYWYFEGDKNAWLERCYLQPEDNRRALVARLERPELCGVVARSSDGVVCGWLNVSPVTALKKLFDQRVYRLPCFGDAPPHAHQREEVYAVACCYVAEAARGQGVARALLQTAIEAVRAAGGSALEAFPRQAPIESAALRPDEVWMGPKHLFQAAGFELVSDPRPYPVLRLHLR